MKATKKELFYNEFSDKWESEINKKETLKRLNVVYDRLLKGINLKGKKFLEVGCGMGYFSEMAQKNGAIVTGIDVGKKLVEKSRQKVPNGKFIIASISNLPFKDETFDLILCTEVIEHVENQNKGLSEVFRVLKKGGYLVLTTPNRIFKPIFDFLSLVGIRPYHGHEKWFYLSKLRKLLSYKGNILKEEYFNFVYISTICDYFEKFKLLRHFMINQGYLVMKKW